MIIQDELHLITGPLGTIYGAYETIIEDLCTYSAAGKTIKPKYVVSTATIKNAAEQTKCLYGRKETAQFPPNGFEIGDSFFIREIPVENDPFRRYVGICASGQSVKTALLRVYAIVLQAAYNLSQEEECKDFSEERFNEIVADYKKFVTPLGIPDVNCIPLSALDGDNVVDKSERTPWYKGISLLDFLETVHIDNDHNFTDFRFPVQYVLRPNLDFRGFCGKVASGIVRKGDTVMALPSGKTSKVKSIVTYDGELDYAFPPQSVTLTLEDEIDVSRGEMLVHPDNLPTVDRNFEAMMVWMDEEPMDINKSFFIKQTTNLSRTRIDTIKYKVDVNTMEHLSLENGQLTKETLPLQLNQIARVVLTTAKELFFDPYKKNKSCGSFILIDPITNNTSAVGMIIDRVEMKDMSDTEDVPVLDMTKLGIAPEHYEAVEKAVKELERQGLAVRLIK